jgi:hypothetical protein
LAASNFDNLSSGDDTGISFGDDTGISSGDDTGTAAGFSGSGAGGGPSFSSVTALTPGPSPPFILRPRNFFLKDALLLKARFLFVPLRRDKFFLDTAIYILRAEISILLDQ